MSPNSMNPMRFDWFKNSDDKYVQIAALVQCVKDGMSSLYVVGFYCTESGVQLSSTFPLPRVRYMMTKSGHIPHMACDEIESVSEPVAVIPTSLNSHHYFTKNLLDRSKQTFCVVPVGFILRDDWDTTENKELVLFQEKLITKFQLREYMNSAQTRKDDMYQDLMGVLWSVNKYNNKNSVTDEEALQEVLEHSRYIYIKYI